MVSKISDTLGQRLAFGIGEIALLRIAADKQRQPVGGEVRHNPVVPPRRAFATRREIAAGSGARIAEPHRHNRNNGGIVELLGGQAGPLAQAFAAGIVPWNAAFMDARARCLTDDDNARSCTELHNWAGSSRQMRGADGAGADIAEKRRYADRCHVTLSAV